MSAANLVDMEARLSRRRFCPARHGAKSPQSSVKRLTGSYLIDETTAKRLSVVTGGHCCVADELQSIALKTDG